MAQAAEIGTRTSQAPGAPAPSSAVLLSDRRVGPDLWGVGEAMRPFAELCVAPLAETPFALGLVGGPGSGKSFALRRLIEAIESRARTPALTKVVVAPVEASDAEAPELALAAAVHAALEGETGNFAQFADEAAHAAVDPRHAAAAASERHDEIVGRLEQERRARDEVEARRARIADAVLYETPGARIDDFARSRRNAIEARLRRFGFAEGDADLNYRGLVRDLSGARAGSRVALFLRAIWAYRGQVRLLFLGVVAFALAYGLDWLRAPGTGDAVVALSAQTGPAVDWVQAHEAALGYAAEALVVLGLLAIFLNLWRAARFTGVLFRGLQLLTMDVRERRRELDASAARLERRVAAMQIEADAASQRAETMARRAGGGAPANRAPGPAFLSPADGPAQAAREFLRALGRSSAVAAPERVVIAIDGLDALPPAEARRFLETAVRAAGPKVAVIAAIDLTRFDDPRRVAEALFEAVYDVEGFAGAAGETVAGRLLSPPTPAPAPSSDAKALALAEPLAEDEQQRLKAASRLIGARPRALKRFYNAYRLARLTDAPRATVALSLAALMAPDASLAAAWRRTLADSGATLETPAGPPALAAAFEALGLLGVPREAARAALAAASRYAPWG